MSAPQSCCEAGADAGAPVKVGALVPMTEPGWVEAGRHLLAGLEVGVQDVNRAGGVAGRPLDLLVRDTAARPEKAAAAVEELASLGVAGLVGEYHSVVARAAASRADALGLPFLCSSAVLDTLTEKPAACVARLAPPQSIAWRRYAEFLLAAGHTRIAVVVEQNLYWKSGVRILRDCLDLRNGDLLELDARLLTPVAMFDQLAASNATALLLLVGYPEPAMSIVRHVRRDSRFDRIMLGAPAGQPEFASWLRALGRAGAAIPFLRYLPERLGPLGAKVATALQGRLDEAPSFVAFEGYDTVIAMANLLRSSRSGCTSTCGEWPSVSTVGTRGQIYFSGVSGVNVWQWPNAPIQIVDRDPASPDRFRILFQTGNTSE